MSATSACTKKGQIDRLGLEKGDPARKRAFSMRTNSRFHSLNTHPVPSTNPLVLLPYSAPISFQPEFAAEFVFPNTLVSDPL
jgi:hypothetical protein